MSSDRSEEHVMLPQEEESDEIFNVTPSKLYTFFKPVCVGVVGFILLLWSAGTQSGELRLFAGTLLGCTLIWAVIIWLQWRPMRLVVTKSYVRFYYWDWKMWDADWRGLPINELSLLQRRRNPIEWLFGVGRISLEVSSERASIPGIRDADHILKTIERLKEQHRKNLSGMTAQEFSNVLTETLPRILDEANERSVARIMNSLPREKITTAQQLQLIADLFDRRLITITDFTRVKADILSRLPESDFE